jgi:hypothetical protein
MHSGWKPPNTSGLGLNEEARSAAMDGAAGPCSPDLARKSPSKDRSALPCTRYTKVELVGACWAPHKRKAPCPETIFEYQGECYLPSFSDKPPPSSLGQ